MDDRTSGCPDVTSDALGGGGTMIHDASIRRRGALLGGASLTMATLLALVAPVTAQTPVRQVEYSIWGDSSELANQIKLVDTFNAAHPDINVKVTVSDWDALLGQAADRPRGWRRARHLCHGRPALPRLPVPRRAPGPRAIHRTRRVRPDGAGGCRRWPTSRHQTASTGCRGTSTWSRCTTTRRCSTPPASRIPTTRGHGTRSSMSASS